MAGTLTISTLSDGTNSTSSTNCIQGSAKAWVNFNGSSGSINASYNTSSVTRNSTGDYTVNFTNAFSDANYCFTTALKPTSGGSSTNGKVANIKYDSAPTTTSCRLWCYSTAGVEDFDLISLACFR
jgi:hypothetical protein